MDDNVEEDLYESEDPCSDTEPASDPDTTGTITDQEHLLHAIDSHDISTAQQLLCTKRISPDFEHEGISPICRVVSLGQEDMLELLISNGCSLTIPSQRDTIWLRHPIHLAASKGHQNIVGRLAECGVDINSKDSDHRTPLHWAATYGHTETVRVLLDKGAVVNVTQCDGFTPLHAATCVGRDKVCKMLIDYGADVNKADADGWNALHTAVCYGQTHVVELLVDNQASVRSVTLDQNTTLHLAASSGYLGVMEILLSHNLDLNRKNMHRFTPFHLALYHGKIDAAKLLLKYGADIQTSDSSGHSPLYLATTRMDVNLVQLLLEAGYDFSKEKWIHNNRFPFVVTKMPVLCDLLKDTASNPRTLQDLICFKIRKVITGNIVPKIETLPIPRSLRDKLAFRCGHFSLQNNSQKTVFYSSIESAWVLS